MGYDDERRTELALRALVGSMVKGSEVLESLVQGCAAQMAAARAKKIVHGSITPSNIALDGAWLDYGTISTVQDHGRYLLAPGAADSWSEEIGVVKMLGDLHFFARTYASLSPQVARRFECLVDVFASRFRYCCCNEFAKLCGWEQWHIERAAENAQDVGASLIQLVTSRPEPPQVYFGDKRHQMPSVDGRISVRNVVSNAARAVLSQGAASESWVSAIDEALVADIVDPKLRRAFSQSYAKATSRFLAGMSEAEQINAMYGVWLDCARRNQALTGLYRGNLDANIDHFVRDVESRDEIADSKAEVEHFIDTQVTAFTMALGEDLLCTLLALEPLIVTRSDGLLLSGLQQLIPTQLLSDHCALWN